MVFFITVDSIPLSPAEIPLHSPMVLNDTKMVFSGIPLATFVRVYWLKRLFSNLYNIRHSPEIRRTVSITNSPPRCLTVLIVT